MDKPRRPPKKPWSPPRLRRYGDLRTLTRGGTKPRDELHTFVGPRTRP